MEKTRDNSSMVTGESQEQDGSYSGCTKTQEESPRCCIDGPVCHLKNAELEPELQKYHGRVVLQVDTVKDDPGSCAVFTEQARLRPRKLLQK